MANWRSPAPPQNQKESLSGNAFLTEECRLRLVNKEKADCFSRVPEPFGSFQLWKERIERLEEKYKWTIKVKIYHKIELLMDQWMSTPFFYWAQQSPIRDKQRFWYKKMANA